MLMSGRNIIATTRADSSSSIVIGSSVGGSAARWREIVAAGGAAGSRRPQADARTTVTSTPRANRLRRRRFIGGAEQNSIPGVATVVIDIETVGQVWESLDDAQRTYLEKNARSDDERARLPETLSLWPLTGRIIVVAMLNPDTGRGQDLVREDRRPRRGDVDGQALHFHRRRGAGIPRRVLEGDAPLPSIRDVQRPRIRRTVSHAPERGPRRDGDAQPRGIPLLHPAAHRSARSHHVLRSFAQVEPGLHVQGVRSREPQGARAWTGFPWARTTGRDG